MSNTLQEHPNIPHVNPVNPSFSQDEKVRHARHTVFSSTTLWLYAMGCAEVYQAGMAGGYR